MTTIAPCPFCGYEDVEIDKTDEQHIAIRCPECLACGPVDAALDGAINLWNVRAPERLRSIKYEGDGVYRP